MKNNNDYFESLYDETIEAIHKLCVAKETLSSFGYLTYNDKVSLCKAIYVLCEKVTLVGNDLEAFNTLETEDIPLPESEVEFTEGVM